MVYIPKKLLLAAENVDFAIPKTLLLPPENVPENVAERHGKGLTCLCLPILQNGEAQQGVDLPVPPHSAKWGGSARG